ncbi:MAG TPA: trehalose-phosphatase [Acidimicrobiales bacterium]|nr:trehalose-phosphatase [Acidimicrobiales bacterium]
MDPLAPFLARPAEAAMVVDFDGTLSPIVDVPADARPGPGAVEALAALVGRLGLVAVMSGRPVDFLAPLLPPGVVLSGLYGLEVVRDGRRIDDAGAGPWRDVVADVARVSRDRGPAGMVVEPKGLSLTLHYRTRPDLEDAVRAWAEGQGARSGLEVRTAKMSVELHPPLPADKGTALEALAGGMAAVAYVGDDRGDLPAYDALDRLASRGVATLRVAVAGAETPAELVDRADLVLDGPAAVVDLLRRLA